MLESEITYSVIKFDFTGKRDKPMLFITPGYSSKSVRWTISRINAYVKTFPDRLKNRYSSVYIINYENVKAIQDANKSRRDQLDKEIALHTATIIRALHPSNIAILGRSAGGGIALQLINMTPLLPITACYLACAGGKITLFEDYLLNPLSDKNIKIMISWSKNDKKIPYSKNGIILIQSAKKYNFKLGTILVDTTNDLDDFNHRIHPQLLYKL